MQEKALYTNKSMWSLWDHNQYKNIKSRYESEDFFKEEKDVVKQIELSKFVPIYINSDGEFQFRVKIDEDLSERESKYVIATSKPYLFKTEGKAYLSGIEFIEDEVLETEVIELNLKNSSYEVVVNIIEWDQEPGMRLPDGSAAENALPDFIVVLKSIKKETKNYKKDIDTFGW